MSSITIRVNNLSKQYRIGERESYKTFREAIVNLAKAPFCKRNGSGSQTEVRNSESNTIWALKDVSFKVKQGEVVGIIGRNGAGKSTLLKILSKITEPTEGRAEIKGRVGSLLEVGTGFHPELTGHENIYLYGAILGMDRWEVSRKFDEIVAFAELEKFIDTPVKRYSSGMYMRLAFAVAAHLEPEILLVDEVLAVGDAAFQKKCLGKMDHVSKEGRTVLFVSHNMDAITRLCQSAIYLENGCLSFYGPSSSVVEKYISDSFKTDDLSKVQFTIGDTDRKLVFTKLQLISIDNKNNTNNNALECHIEYRISEETLGAVIAVRIDSSNGTPIMTLTDIDLDEGRFIKRRGTYKAIIVIPTDIFAPGDYQITISAADMKSTRFDYHEGILSFNVQQSQKIKPTFRREGPVLMPVYWDVQDSQ